MLEKFLFHEVKDFSLVHSLKIQAVDFLRNHDFVCIRPIIGFPRSGRLYFYSGHKHSLKIGPLVVDSIKGKVRFSYLFFLVEKISHGVSDNRNKGYFYVLADLWLWRYGFNYSLNLLNIALLIFLCNNFSEWYIIPIFSDHIE